MQKNRQTDRQTYRQADLEIDRHAGETLKHANFVSTLGFLLSPLTWVLLVHVGFWTFAIPSFPCCSWSGSFILPQFTRGRLRNRSAGA